MIVAPYLAIFPGLAIVFTVLGLNLLGDGLSDVLDPKLEAAAMSLLEIENLSLDDRRHADPEGHRPDHRARRGDGAGRRIRLRQVDDGADRHAASAAAARATGRVAFNGIDILAATEDQMCALRGDDIGMVFQEPMTALNPVKTIGEQVAEGIRWHTRASRADAEDAGAQNARPRRPAGGEISAVALSARTVGRPAPARRHRHRLRAEAEAADRRRADDGARRRAAGADPRPAARSRRTRTAWGCC